MTLATLTKTVGQLAGALVVAAGLLAAVGVHRAAADPATTTTAYPISVACTGDGQSCGRWDELTVLSGGVVRVRFVASATHCSDIRAGFSIKRDLQGALGPPPQFTSFLTPGAGSDELLLSSSEHGAVTILITAQGRPGGCNDGRLLRWSGTVYVTTAVLPPMVGAGSATKSPPRTGPGGIPLDTPVWPVESPSVGLHDCLVCHVLAQR